MNNQIKCPHCNKSFEPSEAYKHELEEKLLTQHKNEIEEVRKESFKKAELLSKEFTAKELQSRDDQIAELRKRAEEAERQEVKLRNDRVLLEESKRKFEVEKQRQLDSERNIIRSKALEEAEESHELKDKEKELIIENLRKSLANAQRQAQQGSQQTQGEVMELELEEMLRREFPFDKISEVKKGQRGADIIQQVIDKRGRDCGIILWEIKNAKWSSSWISTLKENQRQAKAQIAVLVSNNTPQEIESFTFREGVWIANRKVALPLALALRFDLISVNHERTINTNKAEKAEVLYQYITSTDFKHRTEAIVETFADMQNAIETEKRWFTSKWAKQEKQIRRVIDNTLGMRSDLEGLLGKSLPTVDLLKLPEPVDEDILEKSKE